MLIARVGLNNFPSSSIRSTNCYHPSLSLGNACLLLTPVNITISVMHLESAISGRRCYFIICASRCDWLV